ncbi:MAG: hypothetical protein NVSMB46_05150 [Candidatus Saccharimonadales bacterium]
MTQSKKRKNSGAHTKPWFIVTRGSYLPCSLSGWLTYIPYTVYILGVLVYVFVHHEYIYRGLFIVVPNWVAAAAVMNYVASRKS